MKTLQSFNVDSRSCVRVGMDVSEWVPVNVGLRQCCVMPLWLFQEYIDGEVREVNARAGTAECKWWQVRVSCLSQHADSEEKLSKLVSVGEYPKEEKVESEYR